MPDQKAITDHLRASILQIYRTNLKQNFYFKKRMLETGRKSEESEKHISKRDNHDKRETRKEKLKMRSVIEEKEEKRGKKKRQMT